MKKNLDFGVVNIVKSPREWSRIARAGKRVAAAEAPDLSKYSDKDYLFTHATICCSVALEDNLYYIKPECSKFVNDNGNAWANQVLLATYVTFKGAFNFLEHVQIESESKGKILDAVIRPVKLENGTEILYVDLLTATDRKHKNLVKDIESGKLNTMSMGANLTHFTCSKCGFVGRDGIDKPCKCIERELGSYFVDKEGVKRIVAELCGRFMKDSDGNMVADPNSVEFIEASWVDVPAFRGAVLNHFVSEVKEDDLEKHFKLSFGIKNDLDSVFSRVASGKLAAIENRVARKLIPDTIEMRIASSILKENSK